MSQDCYDSRFREALNTFADACEERGISFRLVYGYISDSGTFPGRMVKANNEGDREGNTLVGQMLTQVFTQTSAAEEGLLKSLGLQP